VELDLRGGDVRQAAEHRQLVVGPRARPHVGDAEGADHRPGGRRQRHRRAGHEAGIGHRAAGVVGRAIRRFGDDAGRPSLDGLPAARLEDRRRALRVPRLGEPVAADTVEPIVVRGGHERDRRVQRRRRQRGQTVEGVAGGRARRLPERGGSRRALRLDA
jgi:hypothetical protein